MASDAYAVLRIKDFRWFLFARFLLTFSIQMQSVIVGWQVYDLTKDPLALGMIGLAEAIPFFSVALYAGYVADHFNRRNIILLSESIYLLCAVMLFLLSGVLSPAIHHFGTFPIYGVIVLTGIARGFLFPAFMALMAQLVPRELYPNSSSWNSTFFQVAAVSGPALGGLIYGFLGLHQAYLAVIIGLTMSLFLFSLVKPRPMVINDTGEPIWQSLTAGVKFVFSNQVVLGAISLDMFAVLFGGAVAVLPVFAAEVLHIGPQGLGMLRSAPALGAVFMSFLLAHYPPVKNTGKKLFIAIIGFGLSIIFFALSHNFWLSFVLLIISGMFDNISVIIRSTIMQVFTPDEMRGRVSSVNSIFIGSSNEIGSFESGLAAKIMGLIPSVVFGGSMTLLVVSVTSRLAPVLRKLQFQDSTKKHEDALNE
jgi:MFS family permease